MNAKLWFLLFMPIFFLSHTNANDNLPTVSYLDLNKYTGKWYEVSRLPNSFQKKCLTSTADYGIFSNHELTVLNTCFKKKNKVSTIKGIATIKDLNTNAKLGIKFKTWYSWLIPEGKYWVMALVGGESGPYQMSLVGTPDRKYLWILARSSQVEPEQIVKLKNLAQKYGFDVSKMIDL